MADNKRNSVAGKVATPNLKAGTSSGKDVIGADSDLYKAVGSRYVFLTLRYLGIGTSADAPQHQGNMCPWQERPRG